MDVKTVTDFFQKDHDRLDQLFQKSKAAKYHHQDEAIAFFNEFKQGLLRHIGWEEEILFPAFESKTGVINEGPTAVMRFEHHQIKQVLHAIQKSLAQNQIAETERQEGILLETLTSHNMKEEGILYPSLDQMLNSDEIAYIFKKIENFSDDGHSCCCGQHS